MVWVIGFEPTTSQSRTARATSCATPRHSHILSYLDLILKKIPHFSICKLQFFCHLRKKYLTFVAMRATMMNSEDAEALLIEHYNIEN